MYTISLSSIRHQPTTIYRGVLGLMLVSCMITNAPLATADNSGNADVQYHQGCMQDEAGFDLNCTANDVQLAAAKNITILDDGCAYPGDVVHFTAEFEVVLTAQERHDIGIWFVEDDDLNGDGAISGACTVATPAYGPNLPWLDLDSVNDPLSGMHKASGIQDTCGDIDAEHNPLNPVIELTVQCIDPDHDGKLNLPNCTSWRQSGANELCHEPVEAFPGAPSKCRCDLGFNIDIDVPPAKLLVSKTATPEEISEPGGSVTFNVTVTNIGKDPNNYVILDSLSDDIYQNITTTGHDGITATTCAVPQNIPSDDANPGGVDTYNCSFTATVTGDGGDIETDTVTASGIDTHGNDISGYDSATVTINNVNPSIAMVKTANPITINEPGGQIEFIVSITNNSVSSDPVTINSLTDSIYNDITTTGHDGITETTCKVPKTISGAGGIYSCSFTAQVSGNAGYIETDTVTALGTDDEGSPVSGSDSANVTVNNVVSAIELIKSADPTSLDEPGGNVTYTYTINNKSSVDTVVIYSLMDDRLGNLDGQGICDFPQTLESNDGVSGSGDDTYSCTVTAYVTDEAFKAVTNTAIAEGIDDDGMNVKAVADATVSITNVPPAASLTKTVTELLVTYEVKVCNDSDAESLTVDGLYDDIYGNLSGKGSCLVPQVLSPSGQLNSCYTCSFKEATTTSPTTDTVTATVNDNDLSNAAMPSDSATVSFE